MGEEAIPAGYEGEERMEEEGEEANEERKKKKQEIHDLGR